jgi:hypothetical protein
VDCSAACYQPPWFSYIPFELKVKIPHLFEYFLWLRWKIPPFNLSRCHPPISLKKKKNELKWLQLYQGTLFNDPGKGNEWQLFKFFFVGEKSRPNMEMPIISSWRRNEWKNHEQILNIKVDLKSIFFLFFVFKETQFGSGSFTFPYTLVGIIFSLISISCFFFFFSKLILAVVVVVARSKGVATQFIFTTQHVVGANLTAARFFFRFDIRQKMKRTS